MRQLLALPAGVGVLLIVLFALLEPYRRDRLTAFLDPWAHADGDAASSRCRARSRSARAACSGVGLGESVQKIFYLPEAHTDFILAVIGEELGVVGVSALLFLYGHDRLRGPAGRARRRRARTPSCSRPASPR